MLGHRSMDMTLRYAKIAKIAKIANRGTVRGTV
jgi:hypothetical protein